MASKVTRREESDSSDKDYELEYQENDEKEENESNSRKEEDDDEIEEEDEDEVAEEVEDKRDADCEEDLRVNYASVDTYDPDFREKKKLRRMKVQLRHEPPAQHTIEKTAGTRALTANEKKKFEKYVPLKIGTFCPEEDKIIKKNWKAFCKLHDWNIKNPKPFLFMKHKSKEFLLPYETRIKFVQFLADGLNDRSLYSVYHRFRVMFEPHKTSRYKPEEDNVILNYICNYKEVPNRKFADLAVMLKRTRASVWRRYRVLKKKKKTAAEQ